MKSIEKNIKKYLKKSKLERRILYWAERVYNLISKLIIYGT
tara:strand:- start:681 stop:803 length:123 start_codon:yes stop_codon:yes gene_type:complete